MSPRGLMSGAIAVLSILAIAAALWKVGSPGEARAQRADRTREQHLQQLDGAIVRYREDKGDLPSSLEEATRAGNDLLPVDPESGADYGYAILDKGHYRLCANFHAAHNRQQGNGYEWYSGVFSVHPAGYYCFARTFKQKPADRPATPLATG